MEHLDRRGTGNLADSGILCFFDYSPVYGTVYKRTDEAGTGSGYEIRVIGASVPVKKPP